LKTDDITCAIERFNHVVQQTCNADQQQFRNPYLILTGNQRKNGREKEAPEVMAD